MLVKIKIVDKELFNISTKEVTKDDIQNKCKFYFDKETYEGKELFVTFINKIGYSRTIILGHWQEILSCNIPIHMLDYDYFKIFCYTKDLTKTNVIKIYNTKSVSDISLLIQEIDRKIDNIIYEDKYLKCYSNNKLVKTILIQNIDEEIVNDIITRRLSGFQEQINERLEPYINEEDIEYLIVNL